MKIYAYVDGQLAFNFDIKLPYETLSNNGREYFGIKGKQELLAVYRQVEEQLKHIFPPNTEAPSLDQLNLDETNLNEYLIQKFPQLKQLELRADDGYSSSVKNLFGKQYGYPLVWLNSNKYNHGVISTAQNHQWERCIYGEKLNSLDKIGSLTQYFSREAESKFYQGDYNAWLSSVKNSFTDNLLLKNTRQGSNVFKEIASMQDFQQDKQSAIYENNTKNQVTYLTTDLNSALADSLEKYSDGLKKVKILFPIEVSNGTYTHVIMGSVTLTKNEESTQCDITLYDALTSDPFAREEQLKLKKLQEQVAAVFSKKNTAIEFTTSIYNMKYQLPLQTHCGRFVMTWMAAEVAGLDIKKISNYNEPFNYLFGQTAKNDMNFDSKYPRVSPQKALAIFKEELSAFLDKRQKEFSKQWTSAGKESLDITKSLLDLIEVIEKNGDRSKLVEQLTKLSFYLDQNIELQHIVESGMVNLGYGSLNSFLTLAQTPDFKLSLRTDIAVQYEQIDELAAKMKEDLSFEFDDFEEDGKDELKEQEDLDDFEVLDIDDTKLAANIQPSKDLEQQLKLQENIDSQKKLKEKIDTLKSEDATPTLGIKVK